MSELKKSLTIEDFVTEAELLQVNLKGCAANSRIQPDLIDPENVALEVANSFSWRRANEDEGILAFFTLELLAKASADAERLKAGEEVFKVKVTFASIYRVGHKKYSDQLIDEFCQNTGIFQVHSYMREFVDSSMRRMGIPPFTLPLLKAVKREKSKSPGADLKEKVAAG